MLLFGRLFNTRSPTAPASDGERIKLIKRPPDHVISVEAQRDLTQFVRRSHFGLLLAARALFFQCSPAGIGSGGNDTFGKQCLLARRFVESGVRFVELSHGNWDHHRNLTNDLSARCNEIDTPIAGLITDLKRRDMLNETLIVWAGEFGRTPHGQGGDGRDHNNKGYTTWMAGGGVKGGLSYGATDEYGYEAVDGKMHIHDWHATILHILGLDHEKLTYNHAGRDFRLTDVHGTVAKDILS